MLQASTVAQHQQALAGLTPGLTDSRYGLPRPDTELLVEAALELLPMRIQADHLTVVGERQRLQLEDGSKVLLLGQATG